jgi:ribosomal protein S18 acetylase RimI-like enzyme
MVGPTAPRFGPFCRKLLGSVQRLRSHCDPELSHQLERLAARAWPADEAWSGGEGAERVYLQVETDNPGALAFYAGRGFFIAHSYHYRSA